MPRNLIKQLTKPNQLRTRRIVVDWEASVILDVFWHVTAVLTSKTGKPKDNNAYWMPITKRIVKSEMKIELKSERGAELDGIQLASRQIAIFFESQ